MKQPDPRDGGFFRRGLRLLPAHPLRLEARRILMRANQLHEQGQFEQAALIYESLASKLVEISLTGRVPFLLFQAARARFEARQPKEGEKLLRQGLQMLANERRYRALQRVSSAAIAELRRLDYPQVASMLEEWLHQNMLGSLTIGFNPPSITDIQSLPKKCPACGASVHPGEVEPLEDNTYACAYCGSIL